MAVDSNDPITGRPIFLDSGAPDTGVDPTEVGKYAADVGNRIVRFDLAALEAYEYKRPGLMGHTTGTPADYIYGTSGWIQVWSDTGWQPLGGLATGWSVQGGDIAGYRVLSGVLYLRGRLDATSAATQLNILNTPLPVNARPQQDTPLMLGTTGGSAQSFVTVVQPSGQISCYKGSNTVNDLPLNAFGGIPVG